MSFRLVALLTLVASTGVAQEQILAVEDEPNHRLIFRNEYLQAFRVTLSPGASSLMHTHRHDDVAVRLSDATMTAEVPGQPAAAPQPFRLGIVSARDNEAKPFTHRMHNIGTTPFDVVDVQIMSRPVGAESPPIAEAAAENPKMRVYRYELAPGASSPQHTYSRPYLLVAATAAHLRIALPGGKAIDQPLDAGDLHWVADPVTHSYTNQGAARAIFVEIELK
ncbi:MAG: hypothetical protein ABI639_02365 [Thermoanaerobaculia bacterium]